ncbi:MAG: hypothetical protein VCD33_13610 [Alphaproteobacteria bacterium]
MMVRKVTEIDINNATTRQDLELCAHAADHTSDPNAQRIAAEARADIERRSQQVWMDRFHAEMNEREKARRFQEEQSKRQIDAQDQSMGQQLDVAREQASAAMSAARAADQSVNASKESALATKLTAGATMALAAATIAMAVFGYFQLRVLSDQSQLLSDQLKAAFDANELANTELQAYVSASADWVIHIEDSMPEASISIENTGRTPAKIIELSAGIAVGPPISVNEPEDFWPTMKEAGVITLNAGGSDSINRVYSRELAHEEIIKIKSVDGPIRIYVHGRIVYKDVFDTEHIVPFCHMYYGYKTREFPIGDGLSTSVGYPGTEA